MTKVGLWHIGKESPIRLKESAIDLEKDLEDWIENDSNLVQGGLEIVGRQISIEGGKVDLLAVDPQGRWVVIEIKRSLLRRDVIAQVLDYASSIYELSESDLREKLQRYMEKANKDIDEILKHRDASDSMDPENREVVSFVIGTGKQPGLERISNYLSQKYDFPISIFTFQVFQNPDGSRILAREVSDSEFQLRKEPKKTSTIESVISLTQNKGVEKIFEKILKVGENLDLYRRPYKTSIMFTPPSNKLSVSAHDQEELPARSQSKL